MSLDSTVPVVDDDPQVLEVAATACEEIGLTVLRAEDGAGALEILRENPEVELLLTDIAMPKMTGWELAIPSDNTAWGIPTRTGCQSSLCRAGIRAACSAAPMIQLSPAASAGA
jgi:hypothetical protein